MRLQKQPRDPVFDVDTALQHSENPINPESVIALSETAKALEKDLKKFQNYYGFDRDNKDPLRHASKTIEQTGNSRFQISKPQKLNTAIRFEPHSKIADKKSTANEYMSVLPNGPTSMVSEIQGTLTTELGNKRMQISAEKRIPPYTKQLNVKNGGGSFYKYHRAPVVRNENKVLPFGPHAYFHPANSLITPFEFARGLGKSSFPSKPNVVQILRPSVFSPHLNGISQFTPKSNVEKYKANPRWFKWTKGLATTNGVTTTNTHSNSNQNEPGSVTMNNQVTSSQQSQGSTDIKNIFKIPKALMMSSNNMKYLSLSPSSIPLISKTNGIQMTVMPNGRSFFQNIKLQGNQRKIAFRQKQAFAQDIRNSKNKVLSNRHYLNTSVHKKDVHKTEHKHQWGFGNGNGHGNGVGNPGASGSGGGWGAGGPLNSKVNFPGWNGPPSRFISQLSKNRRLPPITREMWNSFLAEKRQSSSNMQANTVNTAQSSVEIRPANGVQNGKVTAHQWGFGNGQGQGQGQGSPGGTGDGGGWGAGGPIKQNTWLPNQRNAIQSYNVPFKKRIFKTNNFRIISIPPKESIEVVRSQIPDPINSQRENSRAVINKGFQKVYLTSRIPYSYSFAILEQKTRGLNNLNYQKPLLLHRSIAIKARKVPSFTRISSLNVRGKNIDPTSGSRRPLKTLHNAKTADPLSKEMTPQGIAEALPFLKKR